MRIFKVPDGSSPNPQTGEPGPAVVICRGNTYNLWIDHTDTLTGPEQLSEAEAMVFGISARPGTPDNSYIGTVQSTLNSRFGINAANTDVMPGAYTGDGPIPDSLLDLIKSTPNLPPDDEDFQLPWDVEQWNSPAGEPPKRKPIHEKDQEQRGGSN